MTLPATELAIATLRPRSPTEVVDAAVQLYRQNFAPLVMCSAVAQLPMLVLQIVIANARRGFGVDLSLLSVLGVLLSFLSYAVASAIIVRCASDAYMGGTPDVATATRAGIRRLPSLLWANVMKVVLLFIGVFSLFTLSLYWFCKYFAVNAVIVLENRDARDAFRRSARLTRGNKRHVLNALGIVYVIYYVISVGTLAVFAALSLQLMPLIGAPLIGVLLWPLVSCTETVLYYDVRVRTDALDLDLMIDALDPSAATALVSPA